MAVDGSGCCDAANFHHPPEKQALQRLQQQPLIPIWNRLLKRGEAALSET
ncbi:hypothetical protein [Lysobacter tyrosinilyticus]